MELAIDTSTEYTGIALAEHGEPLIELTWHSGQNHTTELIPGIDRVLGLKKIAPTALGAIVVAKGPGSFNGLRVGLSTAKGFALALGVPLVAVSTMEVEAYAFAYSGLPICAIHSAGRIEIAVAKYQKQIEWQCIETEHLTNIADFIGSITSRTIFCGEIPDSVIDTLKEKFADLAVIPDHPVRMRRPGLLATLGWQKLQNGIKTDPSNLQPIYLRQPPITLRKTKTLKT
jgi:tRNA threonylcarbamoyl adenosine modification protein YeaZ